MQRLADIASRAIEAAQWFAAGTTPADWALAAFIGLALAAVAGSGF